MSSTPSFEIPGQVRIAPGNGGLQKIIVTTALADAEVYLHGAHVTHFQPKKQKPILWMSQASQFAPGKPIRGGVPICFPWFGPNKSDPKLPAHGFARLREWQIESIIAGPGGEIMIALLLKSDDQTRALWPADFEIRHRITIGTVLGMSLEVTNRSTGPIQFEEALHSYFAVSDVRSDVSVAGLKGRQYIDKMDNAATKTEANERIRFTGETDRVYIDTPDRCTIADGNWKRSIEIDKIGSAATVVWNPWIAKAKAMADFGDDEWPGMCCVETANVGQSAITLAPSATHKMQCIAGSRL